MMLMYIGNFLVIKALSHVKASGATVRLGSDIIVHSCYTATSHLCGLRIYLRKKTYATLFVYFVWIVMIIIVIIL